MAVAAAHGAVTAWCERELRDFFATIGAGPRTFDHRTVATVAATTLWAVAARIAEAIATLKAVHPILARLEWQLGDLCTTTTAGPVSLNHRLARRITTVISTVHTLCCCYVLLTHDPLERNNTLLLVREPSHGSSNVPASYVRTPRESTSQCVYWCVRDR